MNRIKYFLEWQVYGVCTAVGERMGIATAIIRRYFIYLTFFTMGSPVLIYMIAAFWLNMRRYMTAARRNPLRY